MKPLRTGSGRFDRRAALSAAGALGALLLATGASAYEHRISTPSFGVQLGYGRLVAGEDYYLREFPGEDGRTFPATLDLADTHTKWGVSAHLEIRFVLDRNRAIGFGFDDMRYRRKDGYTEAQKEAIPRWLKFTTVHGDSYFYFNRRSRVTYHVAPLVGIQQREMRFKGSEVATQEFKLLYGSSFGVEYFVRRSFSFELSTRIFALRGGGGTNVLAQPALGVHVYVF